jgi:hypothetical protein
MSAVRCITELIRSCRESHLAVRAGTAGLRSYRPRRIPGPVRQVSSSSECSIRAAASRTSCRSSAVNSAAYQTGSHDIAGYLVGVVASRTADTLDPAGRLISPAAASFRVEWLEPSWDGFVENTIHGSPLTLIKHPHLPRAARGLSVALAGGVPLRFGDLGGRAGERTSASHERPQAPRPARTPARSARTAARARPDPQRHQRTRSPRRHPSGCSPPSHAQRPRRGR